MNLPQENFERAIGSGYHTLANLTEAAKGEAPKLREVNTRKLQDMCWDLEAIQAALRLELLNRANEPMDLG